VSARAGAELVGLDRVTCRYAAETVLEEVTLSVAAGEFVGVVGPSGSGKTSLLRVLTGVLAPAAGAVRRRAGLRTAYVPQLETVDWTFPVTVFECVLMGLDSRRLLPWASRAERAAVAETLARLGLGDFAGRHIRELSGGQQQRVFLARALVRRPDLLLLDEPTAGVDLRLRHEVLHALHDLNAAGTAILLTTHDLNGMASHLPRLVCLNRRVIHAGAPREVLTERVLEATYGAPMRVLQHAGLPVVLDRFHRPHEVPAGAARRVA
jgi:zinc/manganese transport system ATP-binding protein